jgi:hypothetical protein
MNNYEKLIQLFIDDGKLITTLLRKGIITRIDKDKPISFDNLEVTSISSEKKTIFNPEDVESWIDDYRILFKEKNKNKFGDKKSCIDKMKIFVNTNNASKDEIIIAAKLYLSELKDYSDRTMASADYFISYTEKGIVKNQLLKWLEIVRIDQLINKQKTKKSIWS